MSANAPPTDHQRNVVAGMRVMYRRMLASLPQGIAEPVEQRARLPDPETIPADVTVRVEIAPPSSKALPLLYNHVLKTPERVPIYIYSLNSNSAKSESDAGLATTRVIFCIHGGGNVLGHPTQPQFMHFHTHLLRTVVSHLGEADKCLLIVPTYRLATIPENTFPAALQDLVAAYDYVLDKGYNASNIFVAGDSAGGSHAIMLTHLALHSNRPSPCGIISIAPPAMLVHDHMSEHAKAQADKDLMDISTYKKLGASYVGDSGVSRMDPLVSCAYLPFFASWPRTLILVGTADQLIDGVRKLAERLAAANVPVELVEYNERPHGWWIMPHVFPENVEDAARRIAQFVGAARTGESECLDSQA